MNSTANTIVENKVDTAEKLAYAAGKQTREFLFAPEINTIVAYLRILWNLQNFDGSLLIPSVKKELGTITGSFVDYINTHSASVWPSPAFIIYTISGIEYVQAFVGSAGTYGTGQLQVNANQFILVHQSDQVQPTLPIRKIAVGTLSGTVFTVGKNTLGYTIVVTQVADYWLTNIPYFPSTVVRIQDPLTIAIDAGGFVKASWFNQGGFVALKNVYCPPEGAFSDGGEFSHAFIEFEQL